MIAGKSMDLHGNPTFKSDPNWSPPEITLRASGSAPTTSSAPATAVSPPDEYC